MSDIGFFVLGCTVLLLIVGTMHACSALLP